MQKKYLFSFIFYVLLTIQLFSQNLVKNSGFENYKQLPGSFVDFFHLYDWQGEGVFFHKNAYYYNLKLDNVLIPKNTFGYQETHSGKAYAGLHFYISKSEIYGFLIGTLNSALQKDSIYYFETYVSLAEHSSSTIKYIGVKFTTNAITDTLKYITGLSPDIILCDTFITDTMNWTKISGYYRAKGGENRFIFATFPPVETLQVIDNKTYKEYYKNIPVVNFYVDDFYLGLNKHKLPEIDSVVLSNFVLFDVDSDELSENAFDTLRQIVSYLILNPNKQIIINGYTDNTGSTEHNIELSKNRAHNVATYFIINGINEKRITYNGFGEANPIANNSTEEGRQKNRRVEIIIR